MKWLRLYSSVLNDPKVQLLEPTLFKHWVNLLCLTAEHDGRLPGTEHIAFALRLSPADTTRVMAQLASQGLIDADADGCLPHNWNARQFASDNSTERVKRFRGKGDATLHETLQQRCSNVLDTDSDTDTESEKQAGRARAHTREEAADDPPPTTPACLPADEVIEVSTNGKQPLPMPDLKPWRERLADEPQHWTPEEIRTVETVVTHVRGDPEPKQPMRYYVPLLHDLRAGRLDAGQVEAARDYLASRERLGIR